MLDFSRTDFNKAISLNPKQNDIDTQWELVKLAEMVEIVAGQSPKSEFYNENQKGLPFYQGKKDFGDKYLSEPTVWTEKITKQSIKNDILMSVRAPVGNVNINPFERICIGRGLAAIRARDNVLQNYLFHFLDNNQSLFTGHIGMSFDSISTSEELPEIKIPLPPLEMQQRIVNECEGVDLETDQARQTITAAKQQIEELVSAVEKTSTLDQVVDRISDIVNPKEENGSVYYVGLENIESQTGALSGDPQSDFSEIESNKNAFRKGDLLYGKLRPNLNKVHLVQVDGICSTDILVLRPYTPSLATFYKHYFLSEEFNSEVVKTVSGQQLPRTSWEKISRMPVPLIDIPKQLVAEVEQLESEITKAQAVIDNATERKNAILTNYLMKIDSQNR
jgi:restriction endonuclease S subunit